jgi:polyferredoxin
MKTQNKILLTALSCLGIGTLAYFAWMFPFYEFENNSYDTSFAKLFSWDYLQTLVPLFIIIGLSTVGILLILWLRRLMLKNNPHYKRFAEKSKSSAPKQKPVPFIIIRWCIMIVFAFLMIWGGLLFGLKLSSISIPILSCPWNTEQMTESSCYYLSHLNELFELPIKSILLFVGSTLLFTVLLGRAVCGFLCPMGLVQDIMDAIRKKTKTDGISTNEKLYAALTPVKWAMVLVFIELCFIGGNFCNFCPAVAVSPILAGMSTSLYVSGFLMIFVLIGGFFKRRLFCNICPLGYLVGLFHKVSLFRIQKDCTACTECGACYEACPMGIKTIYTERGKADVTEANCILCGECVRCCPEDKALTMTCAGVKLYTSSRKDILSGYAHKK